MLVVSAMLSIFAITDLSRMVANSTLNDYLASILTLIFPVLGGDQEYNRSLNQIQMFDQSTWSEIIRVFLFDLIFTPKQ